MSASTFSRFAVVLACVFTLAACQSSEERAEKHYQNALALISEGDVDRAKVELRNVFDLNGSHREARTLYADTLAGQGEMRDAYGQYLRLAEQFPDDLNARLGLSRIAILSQDWEELRRHGTVAMELAPDTPEVQVIAVTLDYAAAIEEEDAPERREVVRRAAALSEAQPDNLQLRRILVDGALRDNELETALTEVKAAQIVAPQERSLYDTEVSLLVQLGRPDEIEATLRGMIDRFPGDKTIVDNLVRFYLSRDELDMAETFLRDRVAKAGPEAVTEDTNDLVRFLLVQRGPEEALAELESAIETSETPDAFQSLRARILFDSGETDQAIGAMEALLEPVADDDATANEDRVILARMLDATGNRVGAQRLVARVLDIDRTQIAALKLEAGWRIAADNADGAISLLRTALDEAPQDVDALTLMAEAHLRNGNRDLARDMMSLAVQASNSGAVETRQYVVLLLEDERFSLAEEVLIDALRVAPDNPALLVDLAGVYIRMQDWARTAQIEAQLRRLDTPVASRAADGVQASRLSSEGRTEEAVAFLEDLAAENDSDIVARTAVVRARLASGDVEGAVTYAEQAANEAPDDIARTMIYATTLSAVGRQADAEANYRKVLEQDDQVENAWIGLVRALYGQGDVEGGKTALEAGLAAMPEAINLLWAQASFLEQSGDLEGALRTYESLYERAPESPVIVNNYASLLSMLRDDDASLERAYVVSRRLGDSEQPAFQDTLGWIAHRRGDERAAVEYLEPAAAALTNDPMVQYHLAEVYFALGRDAEALTQFEKAVGMVSPDDSRPQIATARTRIETLTARLQAPAADADAEAAPARQ